MYNIAVVCRSKAFEETRAKMGWFSYAVSGLEWTFYPVEDKQPVNKNKLAAKGHDAIVWEDWCWNTWEGDAPLPVYAIIVDSNTSPRRLKNYLNRAKDADVLLIDQDKLSKFAETGKPVYRWQYAVNEHLFAPQTKVIDVAYHVNTTPERQALSDTIRDCCQEQGLSLTMGKGLTVQQLATRYAEARIVVHKATHEQCRSHRFFDALACGACLLTDRVWSVPEDGFEVGKHFYEWDNPAELQVAIPHLLESGAWQKVAQIGRDHVLRFHTWRTRAEQLVAIIEQTQGVKA